jgi:hypothetical protein
VLSKKAAWRRLLCMTAGTCHHLFGGIYPVKTGNPLISGRSVHLHSSNFKCNQFPALMQIRKPRGDRRRYYGMVSNISKRKKCCQSSGLFVDMNENIWGT